jgi:hypothetical protein
MILKGKEPKYGNLDLTNESSSGVKSRAIKFEFIVNIIKLFGGILCLIAGLYLIYNGIKPNSSYSIEISTIKLKDTPIGVVVVLCGTYLISQSNLNIKV